MINLHTDYELTGDQIRSFRANGHIHLKAVATAEEIERYGKAIENAALRYKTEERPLEQRDTYGKAFLQIMNIWRRDEVVREFVMARKFASIAARLIGCERVRLYHDQALFKEAGGGYTPWHQDQVYWPLDTPLTVTMWMPLVDVTADMGAMEFVSGTHKLGYLGTWGISDESQAQLEAWRREKGLDTVAYRTFNAGDATFHAGWMLHRAPPNESGRMRSVMTVIYYPDGTKCTYPDNAGKGTDSDLKNWLPGCEPGGPAASELNPVLWP